MNISCHVENLFPVFPWNPQTNSGENSKQFLGKNSKLKIMLVVNIIYYTWYTYIICDIRIIYVYHNPYVRPLYQTLINTFPDVKYIGLFPMAFVGICMWLVTTNWTQLCVFWFFATWSATWGEKKQGAMNKFVLFLIMDPVFHYFIYKVWNSFMKDKEWNKWIFYIGQQYKAFVRGVLRMKTAQISWLMPDLTWQEHTSLTPIITPFIRMIRLTSFHVFSKD